MITRAVLSTLTELRPGHDRKPRRLLTCGVVLASSAVLLFGGLVAGVCATQPARGPEHCKVYEGIEIKKIAEWVRTEVLVPKGAIVAVMAEGEVWESIRDQWGNPRTRDWQPSHALRFRIGEDGRARWLFASNIQVVRNWQEGFLQFHIDIENLHGKRGGYKSTILIWDRAQEGRIEEDIDSLIEAYPGKPQYRHLLLGTADSAARWGDYALAQRILTRLRNEAPTRTDRENASNFLVTFKR
jgi:hypothetical protein